MKTSYALLADGGWGVRVYVSGTTSLPEEGDVVTVSHVVGNNPQPVKLGRRISARTIGDEHIGVYALTEES